MSWMWRGVGAAVGVLAAYSAATSLAPVAALQIPAEVERLPVRYPVGQRADLAGRPLSILTERRALRHGEFVWAAEGVPDGPVNVEVDLDRQMLRVFRAGHEIGYSVILYGAGEKPTPAGRYRVLSKHEEHRSSLYDADMPFTLRLTDDGIAIHASDVRDGFATHGCIGLPAEFAERLFREIAVGETVAISA